MYIRLFFSPYCRQFQQMDLPEPWVISIFVELFSQKCLSYFSQKGLNYFVTQNLMILGKMSGFFARIILIFHQILIKSDILSKNLCSFWVIFPIICLEFAENLSFSLKVLELFSKRWVILLSNSLSFFQISEKKAWSSSRLLTNFNKFQH